MFIPGHQTWLLGSFLIFADNRFVARGARAILVERNEFTERTGVLTLPTEETVQWSNLDLPYTRSSSSSLDQGSH
jgi:hypothetical protein